MTTTPEPFLKGRFSLYETSDGGYLLAYKPDDSDEEKHHKIPGWVVRMAENTPIGDKINMKTRLKALIGK